MDENAIAGMAFTLLMTALIGGFILLYPLSRRLGLLLEAKLQDKRAVPELPPAVVESLQHTLQSLETEVRRVAERQEFIEQLMAGKSAPALRAPES